MLSDWSKRIMSLSASNHSALFQKRVITVRKKMNEIGSCPKVHSLLLILSQECGRIWPLL